MMPLTFHVADAFHGVPNADPRSRVPIQRRRECLLRITCRNPRSGQRQNRPLQLFHRNTKATAVDYGQLFDKALSYDQFLEQYGSASDKSKWAMTHEAITLTDTQTALLESFAREQKVLVLSGAWCGDCATQCPIFERFAEQTDKLQIRYLDRDDEPDFAESMLTCGGKRVPGVLFLSEDNMVCGRYGDKTLAKFRSLVANDAAGTCSVGFGEPADLQAAVTQEWLDQFERIQWMLRLSGRLRDKHGD